MNRLRWTNFLVGLLILRCVAVVWAVPIEVEKFWKVAWADEFNSPVLDEKIWTRCNKQTSDWNVMMSPDPSLLELRDGTLTLWGKRNEGADAAVQPYVTAGLRSQGKYDFQYGMVRIRAKFKSAQGAWPALWMLGKHGKWPHNGEIDIMEHLNFDPVVHHTVHSPYTLTKGNPDIPSKNRQVKISRDDWNVYGVIWDRERIIFTVNDEISHIYPRVPELGAMQWPFDQPFYFILSMQIGGKWVNAKEPTKPEDFPAYLEVDWVRVYQKK